MSDYEKDLAACLSDAGFTDEAVSEAVRLSEAGQKEVIPSFLYDSEQRVDTLESILLLNQTKEGDVSMILLKKA